MRPVAFNHVAVIASGSGTSSPGKETYVSGGAA